MRAHAEQASGTSTNRMDKLEQENQELRARLDALEGLAQKAGIVPSGSKVDPPVAALTEIILSGFATTSFFDELEPSPECRWPASRRRGIPARSRPWLPKPRLPVESPK